MYKIAITGKANSGKNTLSKLLSEEMSKQYAEKYSSLQGHVIFTKYIAFADPIKEMIRLMFPDLPKKYLYGPSKYRGEVIPGAFKDGKLLTIRNLLQDLGTGVGRSYKENIWLEAFDHKLKKVKGAYQVVIVTDVRFRNEFDHLKNLEFYQIKLLRDSHTKMNHASEINQDSIKDNEFDYIVNNNGTLEDLKTEVVKIVSQIV